MKIIKSLNDYCVIEGNTVWQNRFNEMFFSCIEDLLKELKQDNMSFQTINYDNWNGYDPNLKVILDFKDFTELKNAFPEFFV